MRIDAPTSKWGYADDATGELFAEYVLAQAAAMPKAANSTAACTAAVPPAAPARPFFAVWQTLSSHEPFDVPTRRFEDRMLNSMAFADECIGRLVERLRQSDAWDDLLIIIVADHAYRYPYGIAGSTVASHRIPMLWLGGAVAEPMTVDAYASQTDLAATLLAQLGIPHDDFPFSRDIFDDATPKFGYYCFNDGFGVVDACGATAYDCAAGRTIAADAAGRAGRSDKAENTDAAGSATDAATDTDDAASTAAAEHRLRVGKAILQTTFKTIREL